MLINRALKANEIVEQDEDGPEEEKEKAIIDFSEGRIPYLAAKPVMLGAGPTPLERND